MMHDEAKRIIEVLLFVSEKPLPLEKIAEVLEVFDRNTLRSMIDELNRDYDSAGRSFSIVEVGGGFQLLTDNIYAPWVRKLLVRERRHRLTTPSLETLSIIAYKQPITRPDIEAIRGVNIEGVLETLLERDFIKVVGRKDVVGRPFLYGTTRNFLTHFGLNSLGDLPKLQEFNEGDIQLGKEELIKREEGEGTDETGVQDVKEITQKDR